MKVALLALYFRPDQGIGSIRPENWARWISESSLIDVITKEYPGANDENLPWRTFRRSGCLLKTIDRLNAWRKKRRLIRQVENRSDTGTATKNQSISAPSGVFTYRMPCLHDTWLLSSVLSLWKSRPDVVIATHSPYVTLLSAWAYALTHPKVKLWVDFRDLWAGNHLATGVAGFRLIEHWLERRILNRANAITTVSEGLADYFREQGFGDKTYVIYNAPPEQTPQISPAMRKPGTPLNLCYTGTIYSGWRDPSPLFAIFQKLPKETTRCIFQVASRNAGNLFELIERFDVAPYVDFLGEVNRAQAIELQQAADVLVLIESADPEIKGVLTGKLFEYLATDKPVLLLGPGPDSELYQLLDSHDRLVTLNQLEDALISGTPLNTGRPVDYRDISKKRVLNVLNSLQDEAKT